MAHDIIGMSDMMAVYEVTDTFGIDRESVSVPLEKEGPGSVKRQAGGGVEITVSAAIPAEEWMPVLRAELEKLGFELQEHDDEDQAW